MGSVEQKIRTVAEVRGVIAAVECKLLEECLANLSRLDWASVNHAKFRMDTLKGISAQEDSVEVRLELWGRIEETDRAHVDDPVYEKAVWILEKMNPSLKGGETVDGDVLLFATGNGSSYDKDQRGNIRKKVTAR